MKVQRALLFILILISPVFIAWGQDYSPNSLTVDVFIDGSVNIDYSIEPDPLLPRLNVTLPGKDYANILVVDEDGVIMDWDQNTEGIEVDSIGAEELTISYSSAFLTNKTGSKWTVSVESPVSTTFILPLDAVLVRLSSTPSAISITDNRAAITMPQDLNSISYKLGTTGTKERSAVLLSQAAIKIYQATHTGIIVVHIEELLIHATQAYDSGSYILAEQLSQQIIQETDDIVELAGQAEAQITLAEELYDTKTGLISQETIESANTILENAKQDYGEGKYTSANTKAFEAYTLLQEAQPLNKGTQKYLVIGFGLTIAAGTGILYIKNKDKTSKNPDSDKKTEVNHTRTAKTRNKLNKISLDVHVGG